MLTGATSFWSYLAELDITGGGEITARISGRDFSLLLHLLPALEVDGAGPALSVRVGVMVDVGVAVSAAAAESPQAGVAYSSSL